MARKTKRCSRAIQDLSSLQQKQQQQRNKICRSHPSSNCQLSRVCELLAKLNASLGLQVCNLLGPCYQLPASSKQTLSACMSKAAPIAVRGIAEGLGHAHAELYSQMHEDCRCAVCICIVLQLDMCMHLCPQLPAANCTDMLEGCQP